MNGQYNDNPMANRQSMPPTSNFQMRNQLLQNDLGTIDIRDETPIYNNGNHNNNNNNNNNNNTNNGNVNNRFSQPVFRQPTSPQMSGYPMQQGFNQQYQNNYSNISLNNSRGSNSTPTKNSNTPKSNKQKGFSNFFKHKGGFGKSNGNAKGRDPDDDDDVVIDDTQSALTFNDIPSISHRDDKFNHSTSINPIIPTLITKPHENMSNTEYRKHMTLQKKMAYNAASRNQQSSPQLPPTSPSLQQGMPRAMSLQSFGNSNPYQQQQQQRQQMQMGGSPLNNQMSPNSFNDLRNPNSPIPQNGLQQRFGPNQIPVSSEQPYPQGFNNNNSSPNSNPNNYPRAMSLQGAPPLRQNLGSPMMQQGRAFNGKPNNITPVNSQGMSHGNPLGNHSNESNELKNFNSDSSFTSTSDSIVTKSVGNDNLSMTSDGIPTKRGSPLKSHIISPLRKDETASEEATDKSDELVAKRLQLEEKEKQLKELEVNMIRLELEEKEKYLKEKEEELNNKLHKFNSSSKTEPKLSSENAAPEETTDAEYLDQRYNEDTNGDDIHVKVAKGMVTKVDTPIQRERNTGVESIASQQIDDSFNDTSSNFIKDTKTSNNPFFSDIGTTLNKSDSISAAPSLGEYPNDSSSIVSSLVDIDGANNDVVGTINIENNANDHNNNVDDNNDNDNNDEDVFEFDSSISKPYEPVYANADEVVEVNKFQTITITNEQLHLLTENKELMNEVVLVSTELAESIKRETYLEEKIKLLEEGRRTKEEEDKSLEYFEIELRKKSEKIVELIQQLNDERLRRFIAEEQVLLNDNGVKPSSAELVNKIYKLNSRVKELESRN
ncbi:hypothetical protein Kpol_1025p17 [Vanderwaltozyma polyspora DSM 70294]|uniref:Uncharacterized protein n=1 Tax=Vanderwaltozyma polyspora (strain ATCC 22028 / DSM 70294 / BCRC 21397 / CBS 2163 / NBRC 10782 / NRRL Y-8283 / UCD 57-17) TaxID=436907 RepID=A7TKU2_VANPO|nr:uncharacterized protein Kpol_1025p17 [Vanderwaltozyma polyspora DSM 70294]EDO17097.1 hypothetical protein Kpol_1025p17 [Vanderwaltozyma polyspora DSM 70294]